MNLPITHTINIITSLINSDADMHLRKNFSISFSEFLVISGIASKKDCSQKDIISFTNLSKGMVSRIINHLQNKKFIKIKENLTDKRNDVLNLTSKGLEIHQKSSYELEYLFIEEYLKDISGADRQILHKLLTKILQNIYESK